MGSRASRRVGGCSAEGQEERDARFKALGRIATFFGGSAGVVGTGISMLLGTPFLPSVLSFGVMFGSVGLIAGLGVGVVASRLEAGQRLENIPTSRAAAWGFVGGCAPVAIIAGLALASSATAGMLVPLLTVGAFCGTATGALVASAAIATKRAQIAGIEEKPSLPA